MSLKTLKDLLNESRYDRDEKVKLDAVLVTDLRQDAIKDIKELIRQRDTDTEWNFLYNPTRGEIDQVIFYIKFKFNITEEDLK